MRTEAADRLVLHQFRASGFNEKARWALAFKALPHRVASYVPGAHEVALRNLSGQTATPVLQAASRVIVGSAAIIEFLDRLQPTPPLYPFHVTDRSRALEVQRSWDLQIGPAARLLLFAAAAVEMDNAMRRTEDSDPAQNRRRYRAALAFLGGVDVDEPSLTQGIYWPIGADDPTKVRAARDSVARGLDWLAANSNASGQLITDAFTVADLTCAALLSPLVDINHAAVMSPVAPPESVLALREEYRQHPAVHWVHAQYRKHRGQR